MTILVITALAAIATPFAISMRIEHEQAKSYVDYQRARHAARMGIAHTIHDFYNTHPSREYEQLLGSVTPPEDPEPGTAADLLSEILADTPDYDGLNEITPAPDELIDVIQLETGRAPGIFVSAIAEDENSKININSATPILIANLLGVSQLADDLDDNKSEILLLDSSMFFSDGNPDTYDGVVRIRNEYITYRHIDREAHELQGCLRGLFTFNPAEHTMGTLVRDARGYKIWEHKSLFSPGNLTAFETPTSIREIANWTKFDFLASALVHRRIYTEWLREMGMSDSEMEEAGIDLERTMRPEYEPSAEERRRMAETDKKIREFGFDPDVLREAMGENRVNHIANRLSRVSRIKDDERRQKALDWFKRFEGRLRERLEEMEERAKNYFPDHFKALRELMVLRSLTQLETLRAIEYEKVRPHITTSSNSVAGWLQPARLTSDIPRPRGRNEYNHRSFSVSDSANFNPGTLVKIVGGGGVEYAVIESARRGHLVAAADFQGSFARNDAWVYPAARHPVNVNAAPPEVLMAVLTGVGHQKVGNQKADEGYPFVTPEVAGYVAEEIYNRVHGAGGQGGSPLTCHRDLHDMLISLVSGGVLTERNAWAIMVNAINPNSNRLQYSTTGFTYRTHDVYTIESTGVVLTPAGPPRARCTIRETVEVAPPEVLTWPIDSQADLTHGILLRESRSAKEWLPIPGRSGFKYVTRPRRIGAGQNYSFTNLTSAFPDTSHDPRTGNMRLETVYISAPPGMKFENHFDGQLNGGPLVSALGQNQFPTFAGGQRNFMGAGFYQTWIKAESGGSYTFFDYGEAEYENRIRFAAEGNTLVFEVADATLDRRSMRVTGSGSFQPGVWYHIAASWRGPRIGEAELYIDGRAVGATDPNLFTRLAGSIDNETFTIPVQNVAGLPVPGVVQVGQEIIEYVEIQGSALIARRVAARVVNPGDPPLDWNNPADWRRISWCRGVGSQPHASGEMVSIYGYSNELPNGEMIRVGGANLVYALPNPTPRTRIDTGETQTNPTTGQEEPVGIDEFETDIGVADPSNFPPDGVIEIDDEQIWYSGYDNDSFTGCIRGVLGTTAAPHEDSARVTLISLRLTDNQDYEDRWYVQLDDEWVYVEKPEMGIPGVPNFQRMNFMMPTDGAPQSAGRRPSNTSNRFGRGEPWPQDQYDQWKQQMLDRMKQAGASDEDLRRAGERLDRAYDDWKRRYEEEQGNQGNQNDPEDTYTNRTRGMKGTGAADHPAGTMVIPVFMVSYKYCGPDDLVTVLDESNAQPAKAPMIINHACNPNGGTNEYDGPLVAFTNFVPRRFDQAPFGRLLKWPSGEMPRVLSQCAIQLGAPATFANGGGSGMPSVSANHDELIIAADAVNQTRGYGLVQSGYPVGAGETQIYVRILGSNPTLGGTAYAPNNRLGMHNRGGNGRAYGLAKIGDEVIAVMNIDPDPNYPQDSRRGILTVVRGCLGTAPMTHNELDPIWPLPYPAMGVSNGVFDRGRLQGDFSGYGPQEGYIQVELGDAQGGGEIVPYKRRGNRSLTMFIDVDENPVGRGAFGSPGGQLAAEQPVIFKAARYWDIFSPRRESKEIVHLLRTETIRGAHWRKIYWRQKHQPGAIVRVFLRFDGKPSWTARATNQPGGIYHFRRANPPDGNLIGVTADMVEIKIHLTYQQGAYQTDAWKDTQILHGLFLEYERPVQVISSEESTK
jgi:hypothetical protein